MDPTELDEEAKSTIMVQVDDLFKRKPASCQAIIEMNT